MKFAKQVGEMASSIRMNSSTMDLQLLATKERSNQQLVTNIYCGAHVIVPVRPDKVRKERANTIALFFIVL